MWKVISRHFYNGSYHTETKVISNGLASGFTAEAFLLIGLIFYLSAQFLRKFMFC